MIYTTQQFIPSSYVLSINDGSKDFTGDFISATEVLKPAPYGQYTNLKGEVCTTVLCRKFKADLVEILMEEFDYSRFEGKYKSRQFTLSLNYNSRLEDWNNFFKFEGLMAVN